MSLSHSDGVWPRLHDRSGLLACMKLIFRRVCPSLCTQKTDAVAFKESKPDLSPGGNVKQSLFLEGCRCQSQEAGWDPGNGTQNGSGANVHLLSKSTIMTKNTFQSAALRIV